MADQTPEERNATAAESSVNPPVATDASAPAVAPVQAAAAPPPKIIRAKPSTLVLMSVVALLGIALILWAWRLGPFDTATESTDDSYVRGAITVLAPQVNGYVAAVLVKDYDHIKQGQPLVRIDQRIYREKVQQMQGQLDNAQAQLDNAEQTIAQNRATLDARRANLAAVQAEQTRASAEQDRVEQLARQGSVSLNERDRVRATTGLAIANVLKAKADIDIAQEQLKATQVSRGGLKAQVEIAQAQLGLAKIDLSNTVIYAPQDGQISEASVRLGQYVAAGSQLMFLVPDAMWVVANFKENQTANMRIGQPVHFSVDALDGATLTGRIQEIAPATGSEFSILRPDNASGNFTKVVQRLPVRIAIDPGQDLATRLRPGMSVITDVDTTQEAAS